MIKVTIPTQNEIYAIYEKLNLDPKIRLHCIAVNKYSLILSDKLREEGFNLNLELINAGSLLHDIGRALVHDLSHGIIGGKIIKELGYNLKLQRIAETHVLGGFNKKEAKELGFPLRNYLPQSLEEKICCYVDKLFSGEEKVTLDDRFNKWKERFGETTLLKIGIKRLKQIEKELTIK